MLFAAAAAILAIFGFGTGRNILGIIGAAAFTWVAVLEALRSVF
jgi:hypothetical protein